VRIPSRKIVHRVHIFFSESHHKSSFEIVAKKPSLLPRRFKGKKVYLVQKTLLLLDFKRETKPDRQDSAQKATGGSAWCLAQLF